jgi:saccharopine dehydrogenase (NAD+, L-lysine-forming)
MSDKKWMIFGANGYTAKLTTALAKQRGYSPILAGRNAAKVSEAASGTGFETRVFDLADFKDVRKALEDVDAVLHMAGPFSATSKLMVDACLDTRTHYLDITGEIPVIESVLQRDSEAKTADVILIPGVGFDVVPTDCLAAMLKDALPDAVELELAFGGSSVLSPGTTKTMIEGFTQQASGAARIGGQIVPVPAAWKTRDISFPTRPRFAVSIPWGDIASAFYSTGIQTITTYAAASPKQVKWLKLAELMRPVLGLGFVQKMMKTQVEKCVHGPNETQRAHGYADVWGQVTDSNGHRVSGSLTTPEGYTLTADSSLRAVMGVLEGRIAPGAYTPSLAFGKSFIAECDGVTVHPIKKHD